MKINKYAFKLFFLIMSYTLMAQPQNKSIDEVVDLMDRVIHWQSQQTDHVEKYTLTNWQFATYYMGMMKAFKTTGNTVYQDYLYKIGEDHNWETMPDMYHADKIAMGQIYLDLYQQKGGTELIKNLKWVLDANLLRNQPKPDVRYKDNPYKHEWWSWCDALFMAPPTFAKMYQITGEQKYLDYAIDHWLVSTDYLWDKEEHLIYRDDRYFDKRTKSGKKIFWSRGNGWVFGGLVHMLEMIPENHPKRHLLVDQFQKMAQRLLDLQEMSSDGLWRANLLDPGIFAYLNRDGTQFIETDKADIPENSGSAFFCYGFVWGINKGLLDPDLYEKPMVKAWKELTQHVNKEGRLGFVQPVGKDPKPYGEDSWQEFGTGAFLLAASEYINYLKNPIKKNPISYQKQSLFYENDFSSKSNLKDWVLEGEAKVVVKQLDGNVFPRSKIPSCVLVPRGVAGQFYGRMGIAKPQSRGRTLYCVFCCEGIKWKGCYASFTKKENRSF